MCSKWATEAYDAYILLSYLKLCLISAPFQYVLLSKHFGPNRFHLSGVSDKVLRCNYVWRSWEANGYGSQQTLNRIILFHRIPRNNCIGKLISPRWIYWLEKSYYGVRIPIHSLYTWSVCVCACVQWFHIGNPMDMLRLRLRLSGT